MTSLKRNQIEYLKSSDMFPSIHVHSSKRKNVYSAGLWNNFSYSSDEIRLMKQVKDALNSNTFEIVKHKMQRRKHRDVRLGIMSINNLKHNSSSPEQNFDVILPKKLEYFVDKVQKHKDFSSSASTASPNSTPTSTTTSVPKMDNRKTRLNELDLVNTDESGEFFTHSSLGSFRYQLSGSNSSKNRQRSKLNFKIRSKNFTARKFFRHKVRMVIILLRLVDCAFEKFKKNFMRIQQNQKMDNITELVQETFSAPTDSDKVVFNKDYYKAKKETDLSRDIQFALTIPPESRTPDQIKLARIGLLKMESFAEYPVNMQEKICKCAFYQKIPPKRVVIRQGQVADSFYFIISGQAMVTVLDEDKRTGDVKNRILAVLKDGTCFGELAFLYNTTRTATVTSLTTMELISIGRDDFYDIFMSNRGQEPEHIQFLRNCQFTKDWPIQVLLQNPTSCVFHYYKRNQVIVPDSTKNEYIFVVKSGTCQVMKKLDNVKPRKLLQGRAISKENFLTDTYKAKVNTRLRRESIDSSEKHIPWSVTHLNEASNKDKLEPVFLQVQTLKPGDTFGLNILKFDETDVNVPNPHLSLVSNGSEVLMLKKDTFLRHSNDKVKENIRHMFQPFASTKEMQRKLQTAADWKYFKAKQMKELYDNLKKSRPISTKLKI